jgi:hypothetical protein
MAIKKLGIVNVTSGKIVVGDPCYDNNGDYETLAAVNGVWLAHINVNTNTKRVTSLVLQHSFTKPDPGYDTLTHLGVDSGQMAFFDAKSYRVDKMAEGMTLPKWCNAKRLREEGKGEKFYGACCDLTYSEKDDRKGGNFKEVGVVCSSGWGDGSYPLNVWMSGKRVVKVQVKF